MFLVIRKIFIIFGVGLGLLLTVGFERVIGLPLLFSLFGLLCLNQAKMNSYQRPLIILFVSFLLAVVYQVGWLYTIIVWFFSELALNYQQRFSQSVKRWLLLIMMTQNGVWWWLFKLEWSYWLLAQLVVSYLIIIIWFNSSRFAPYHISLSKRSR
ncbi:MAG TPA: hypothetical protein PLM16_00075 [Candidatus Woesebacteria bacterium]|nr:hypothetical protein [Candidatus Woesebacteria bacterium]